MAMMRVANDIPIAITEFHRRALIAIRMFGTTEASKLRSHMQTHRKWEDRSGDAKRSLDCKFEQYEDNMRYVLSHGVDYGIWLEEAHEKRFAILEPTARLKGPEVVSNMENLLDRIGSV